METEWPTETVAELQARGVLLVEDGNHGEYRPRANEFGSEGHAFIRAADMANGRVLFDSAGKINQTALDRIRKGVGRPGDVLFSHKGTVGKLALVPQDAPPFVCSPQTTFWRTLDEDTLDKRFLLYFMHSRAFVDQYAARKGETDMADYVSLTAQRTFEVPLPPLDIQRDIARVLGQLDDKIELNRRMNETLEATARSIFRSWFVDFDPVVAKTEGRQPAHMSADTAALFPDHFEETAGGPIPAGWRMGTLGELGENPRYAAHPAELAEDTPYIALEHMPRRSIALAEWGTAAGLMSGKYHFNAGNVLFGKLRPYFHKVGVAPVGGICSTDVLVIVPSTAAWQGVLLGHLSSREFIDYTDAGSTGTKMPRTNWDYMAMYDIAIPSASVAKQFTEVSRKITDRIVANIHESHSLAAVRDTLLPRLLSGEIRLGEAAREVANA